MFDIFVKKKEIVLECFINEDFKHVNHFTPIDYGYNFFPEWWKTSPNETDTNALNTFKSKPTIKSCVAFKSFYLNSIIIPSWFELELNILANRDIGEYSWMYTASSNDVSFKNSHPKKDFLNYALEDGNNIKIESPWFLKTQKNVEWVWSQPTWSLREHLEVFTVLPGVINFKYQHGTNINLFVINEDKSKDTTIKPKTPLVALHPMSDYKVTLKHFVVDKKEINFLNHGTERFFLKRDAKDLSKLYNNKKKIIDDAQNKCPFKL